jgi:hypothetical protein
LVLQIRGNICEELGGLCVSVGLSVKLHCLHLLVLLNEVRSVLLEQPFDLEEVVLLSKFDRHIPLIEYDATVYGLLDIAELDEGLHRALTQSNTLELLSQAFEQRALVRNVLD